MAARIYKIMNLNFDLTKVQNYHSASQMIRVLTESWVESNMFCPRCGALKIQKFENNRPVADFYCPVCKSEYELKSKNGALGKKINDGAYETMIQRISCNHNPDFFFMSYEKTVSCVKDFIFVPKHFFVPDVIEKRKPLSANARRAGWVGCNILIDKIPEQGRIAIVSNGTLQTAEEIVNRVRIGNTLAVKDITARGWLMDVLNCVNKTAQLFDLEDIYKFEEELQVKHPMNHNVRPKIRQQLQFLRDRGIITFLGNGKYYKTWNKL